MSTHGAEFRKTDLQIHSPRDCNWVGPRPEDILPAGATNEHIKQAREAYCKQFIEKCIEKDLFAISITDHHEGVYVYEALRVLKDMRESDPDLDFWLFPGMELTCKDSSQALIVFDGNLTQALFEKSRSKLGLPTDVQPERKQGIQVKLLGYNIDQLQVLLSEDNELSGRFIIFPHVKPGGYKTVLRKGFHKRFKEMPYVGGYMDKTRPDDLSTGDRRILDGEIPAWTSEKRGVISCSDARHADFGLIGDHATWIKIATPTAESLRQAMLAPDSRIRHSEPDLPGAVISEVIVSGSKYLADGTYSFNQQMNSIIGGRGAGKSTLLEYVRFALGRSAIDDGQGPQTTATERMKEILEGTLDPSAGEISLKVLLNGTPITLIRSVAKQDVISVIAGESANLLSVSDVRRLIPTQQYRQGELSELARGDAENRLLDIITAPASHQLGEIETNLKKNEQSLSEALSKAVRLSAAQHAQSHTQTQQKILESQIENLEKQLSADDKTSTPAITNHNDYVRQSEALESARIIIEQSKGAFSISLTEFITTIESTSDGQPIFPDNPKLTAAFESLKSTTLPGGAFNEVAFHLISWFRTELLKIEEAEAEWMPIMASHENEYAGQKRQLAGKQSVLESVERLREQLVTVTKQLKVATTEVSELQNADDELNKLRDERSALKTDLSTLVDTQIATIKDASSGLAYGVLSQAPRYDEIKNALFRAFDLPHMRANRIEQILENVRGATNKEEKWKDIQNESLYLLKWKEGAPEEKGEPPLTPILSGALGSDFMDRLKEAISTERVSVLLQAILRPRVEVFHLRGDDPIEFRKASQGEQAATLLNILMNQSHGPLIIDQPEEDLDNRIINEIIKTIRSAKDRRQLILATHNANIAVNGDSENVIEMVLGKQKAGGAIDEGKVRDAITDTMEGGKDAFELRRKKYNF